MVRPSERSRSKVRKRKRTPGGKLKVYFVKRKKTTSLTCPQCGKPIHGSNLKEKAKTKKRPSRLYPELCVRCSRLKIKQQALLEG